MLGVTTETIAKNAYLRGYADKIMTDVISLANEDLNSSSGSCDDKQQQKEKEKDKEWFDASKMKRYCWELTDNMGAYQTSTVIDLLEGNKLESEFLFNRPYKKLLDIKKKKNKSYPYLESLLSTVLGVNSIYDSIRADGKKWKSNMIDR